MVREQPGILGGDTSGTSLVELLDRVVHRGAYVGGDVVISLAGIDLVRDGEGDFRVLEDNVRVPSGVSYVMTNRRALSAALPEVSTWRSGSAGVPVGTYQPCSAGCGRGAPRERVQPATYAST